MRIIPRRDERVKVGERINVLFMGDLHLGAPDTNYKLIQKHLKRVERDPNARVVFLGDFGEFIDYRDHRFKPDVIGALPTRYRDAHMSKEGGVVQETIDHCQELFEPVKGKIWAWLDGNHEEKIVKKFSFSPGSILCHNLNILSRYVGYGGYVPIGFIRGKESTPTQTLKLDLHHGWQAGRRDGAVVNQGQVELAMSNCDIVARGHSHKRGLWAYDSWFINRQGNVMEWPRFFVATGTYKQGHVDTDINSPPSTTYELQRGFTPKTQRNMGGVWFSVHVDRKNCLHVETSI